MKNENKKFLIIVTLIVAIVALCWVIKRWYFVYKCNAITGGNYGYKTCYYIYNGEWPTSVFPTIFGGLLMLIVFGVVLFSWMYIPQKFVGNILNRNRNK